MIDALEEEPIKLCTNLAMTFISFQIHVTQFSYPLKLMRWQTSSKQKTVKLRKKSCKSDKFLDNSKNACNIIWHTFMIWDPRCVPVCSFRYQMHVVSKQFVLDANGKNELKSFFIFHSVLLNRLGKVGKTSATSEKQKVVKSFFSFTYN